MTSLTKNWTPLAITWLVLAIAGLIGTWTFNVLAIVQLRDYIGDAFPTQKCVARFWYRTRNTGHCD